MQRVRILFGLVMCLITIGIIMLFSATRRPVEQRKAQDTISSTVGASVVAEPDATTDTKADTKKAREYDPLSYLKRQGAACALGLVAMILAYKFDYRNWRYLHWLVALVCIALLVMCFAYKKVNGSHRWLPLGPLTMQPSELAKFAVILLLARWMSKNTERVTNVKYGLLIPGFLLGCFIVLIVAEPDFGTTALCAFVGMVIMYAGGTPSLHLGISGLIGAIGFVLLIMSNRNRMARLTAFTDPEAHAGGMAYQLIQGLYAIASGGAVGVGLGEGIQKLYYLPEAHTDFIFAVIGEEFGLGGMFLVMALFVALLFCGMSVARAAPDDFGRLLALGITLMITMQAAFNIGVVTGVLPTKGLPLPFISYGGTSLIVTMAMAGVLGNVARQAAIAGDQQVFAVKDRMRRT